MSGKYGLIIANSEYSDPGLAQLTAPGKDAKEFWRVLNSPDIGGFDDVMLVFNQDSATVNERIEHFFAEKKPDDLLLLYFSGHGVRDENGALYLAVKNTNRNRLRSTGISSSFIREVMDQSRSKRQVLILDCCNSGAFAQGTKAATGVSIGTATAFGAGYGHIVLTASDSTQYAWEGDKVIGGETENSLFTHFLVKGLEGAADRDGDGQITVDELYDYAYEQVKLATPKQTPSKFSTKQQGEIPLRQGMRIEDIKPIPLPAELKDELEDKRPYVREAAVQQLIKLLNGKNLGLARSAREALEHIAENDDSRTISRAAFQSLEAIKQAEAKTQEGQPDKLDVERKAEAERLIAKKAEEERLAKAKVDAELKAKTESDRLAMQKAEAERMAQTAMSQAAPVAMKAETVSATPQKKPISKGLMIGGIAVAAVVVLGIAWLGINAMLNNATPAVTEAPMTEAPVATEAPITGAPVTVNTDTIVVDGLPDDWKDTTNCTADPPGDFAGTPADIGISSETPKWLDFKRVCYLIQDENIYFLMEFYGDITVYDPGTNLIAYGLSVQNQSVLDQTAPSLYLDYIPDYATQLKYWDGANSRNLDSKSEAAYNKNYVELGFSISLIREYFTTPYFQYYANWDVEACSEYFICSYRIGEWDISQFIQINMN